MSRRVIYASGFVEDLPEPVSLSRVLSLIGAETLDTVSLRQYPGPLQVMLVDDLGHEKGRPVNHEATRIYHERCREGTTHEIVGDVVIVFDSDFIEHEGAGL